MKNFTIWTLLLLGSSLYSCNSEKRMDSFYQNNKDSLKKLNALCIEFNQQLEFQDRAIIIRKNEPLYKISVSLNVEEFLVKTVTFSSKDLILDTANRAISKGFFAIPKKYEELLNQSLCKEILRMYSNLKFRGIRFDSQSVFFSLGDRIKSRNPDDEAGILFFNGIDGSFLTNTHILKKLENHIYLYEHFMEM